VAAACVALQDRYGLDVNVLLFAAYAAAHHREVTAEHLADARGLVDEWHRAVVQPLRGVRRLLKSGPAPAPSAATDAVRKAVNEAELDAELIELDMLDGWMDAHLGRHTPQSVAAALELAVRAYSHDEFDDEAHRALRTIASAAERYGRTAP
jgi:uncharacterized protein (TIGR02444 family)